MSFPRGRIPGSPIMGLPGAKGDQGAPGANALTPEGPWDSTRTYFKGEIVSFGPTSYASVIDGNLNISPVGHPAQWLQLMAVPTLDLIPAPVADVALSGFKATGAGDAVADTDLMNRRSSDARFLPLHRTLDAIDVPAADVSLNGHKASSAADATADTDLVNRRSGDVRWIGQDGTGMPNKVVQTGTGPAKDGNAEMGATITKEAPLDPRHSQYGAVFDGATDAAAKVQLGLNAMPNGGQMLWPGDAIIEAPLVFPNAGIEVIGLGVGKSRLRQKAGTAIQGVFQSTNNKDISIKDLEIDQSLVSAGTTTQQQAIYVIASGAGTQIIKLRRVFIHGGPSKGIYLLNNGTGGLEIIAEDLRVESFGDIGVYGAGTAGVTKGRFYGGHAKFCVSDGMQLNRANNIELHGWDTTDQSAGHGTVFSGVQTSLFTYNCSATVNPNQLTNVTVVSGTVPTVGQTVHGGIGPAGLGIVPVGATILAITGAGPYTITLSTNVLANAAGASAVSGSFSHNIRIFGGAFSRNDPTGALVKTGLVFSVGSYDFQVIAPRCDANGGMGITVDVADNAYDQIIYDCGGVLLGPICTNQFGGTGANIGKGGHGLNVNLADGLSIVGLRSYGNKGNGIGLTATRALIAQSHLINNGAYGWASADIAAHPGAPPMGGHRLVGNDIRGNSSGRSSDVATTPSVDMDLAAGTDVQIFTAGAGQTWTKPFGAKIADLLVIQAGGGGGAGRRGAAGTVRCGGGGGGGGGARRLRVRASLLNATEIVNVAAGGAGAAATAADNTDGLPGTSSTATWFKGAGFSGSNVGGAGGGGGTNASGAAGAAGAIDGSNGGAGGAASTAGGVGTAGGGGGVAGEAGSPSPATGGGAGGGITSADSPSAGSAGGPRNQLSGGAGGAVNNPGGTVASLNNDQGSVGGGGGGASITGAGQPGGAGSYPGGGGGGGGASLNGNSSGAGGSAGDGLIIAITET